MKPTKNIKTIFIFCSVLMLEFTYAQDITKIVFENTRDFTNANLDGVPDHLKKVAVNMASKHITVTYLYFNSSGNVWYESVDTELNKNTDSNDAAVQLKLTDEPKFKIYKNYNTNTCEILEDNVTEKMPTMDLKWQITSDVKTILGYQCKKATADYDGKTMVVYFTTKIKGVASPGFMNALPGVVLEYDNTSKHGIATEIFFNQPNITKFF